MKYGTQTRLKSLYPYVAKTSGSVKDLSAKAQMRLKWMRYIEQGHSVIQCSRHFDHPERTIRYWKARYDPNNISTLENRSRRPKRVRKSQVPLAHIELVILLRKKYPSFGKDTEITTKKRDIHRTDSYPKDNKPSRLKT